MLGKMVLSLAVVLYLASGVMQGQQNVPPPPKPADDGPSLEVTMKFIQDKLSDLGEMHVAKIFHNNQSGQHNGDQTIYEMYELTNFRTDSGACRISYHWTLSEDLVVLRSQDISFDLKEIEKIVVLSGEQFEPRHPDMNVEFNPPVFVLNLVRPHDTSNALYFFDEDLANRVAKAMVHAVELCGGGSKDPF